MTIYTPGKVDKKDSDVPDPEVCTEPLNAFKDKEDEEDPARVVKVTYFPRSKRTVCLHLLLTLLLVVVLVCGAVGAVVFYRHISRRASSGWCGVRYYDSEFHQRGDSPAHSAASPARMEQAGFSAPENMGFDFMDEDIEVMEEELVEHLHTPHFDEVRETTVWHDWHTNFTALVDEGEGVCYIMPLNRSAIAPPRSLLDLLEKLLTGYYFTDTRVIRENYRVVGEALELGELLRVGPTITSQCAMHHSYWLQRIDQPRYGLDKRAAGREPRAYAMLGNQADMQTIFKLFLH